jgi:hypothetical protein
MGIGAAIAGGLASGLVGSLFGGGKTQPSQQYQTIPGTPLQPYTYRTSIGTSTGAPEGDYGFTSDTQLSPQLQALQQTGFSSATPFYQQLTSGLMQRPVGFNETYSPTALGFDYTTPAAQFEGTYDPAAEADRIFKQESALLDPKFKQQATDLQARLFGSGRLGAQLASQEAGGMVNPEAYGLQRAQQQTLAELAASASQRGQSAAQQRFATDVQRFNTQQAADAAARQADIARFGQQIAGTQEGRAAEVARLSALGDIYGLNYSAQQDYLQNLLTGGQTLFGLGQSVYGMERQLAQDALSREIARSNALKQGTQAMNLVETPQSVFAGQLANTVGTAVSDYFNPPSTGLSDPYYTFNYGSNFGANAPMATVNTGTGMFSSGGGYYNELGNYGSFAPNAFTFGG